MEPNVLRLKFTKEGHYEQGTRVDTVLVVLGADAGQSEREESEAGVRCSLRLR